MEEAAQILEIETFIPLLLQVRYWVWSKENRVLRQITVEDAVAADKIFSDLMGEEVEPRRKYIEENAVYVENLDI